MIDIVYPNQNEEEFIRMAERLGYDSLCFFYNELKPAYIKHLENLRKNAKIRIYSASSISKKLKPDILMIKTTYPRQWLENSKIDMIFGVEGGNEKDTIIQKKSGLNHILCAIAKQKSKIICIDFGSILTAKSERRVVIMGRVMQNIKILRKYNVDTAIASFAHDPLDMRNPKDIKAFFSMLGMDDSMQKRSLECAEKRIAINIKKKNKEYISEGIEVI